ncbi:pseudouridine synthase [Martiniozyma asiatica (nom. inval.)]|nr:pseudouridine synthase [Martiniozyma asiatica]
MKIDYSKWSKADLICRLVELESSQMILGSSSNFSNSLATSTSPSCSSTPLSTPSTSISISQTSNNNSNTNSDNKTSDISKKLTSNIISKSKKVKSFDFSKYPTRPIALRFSYLGWPYQGLALQSQPTDLPTIESEILNALFKLRLIPTLDPKDCSFSRCGRTDRGVSAMNQVISLTVRSKLSKTDQIDVNDHKELDYIRLLNRALPTSIRFHGVSLHPPTGFDARFSCTFRHYKYIFYGANMNIENMKKAAAHYQGHQDFRNFCKIDAAKQIHNFMRRIDSSTILPVHGREGWYVFDLIGSAFLWHQVRCMVSVLLSVGQGLEDADIVKHLLNVELFPSRPVYKMAHDVPLVLWNCGFENIQWKNSKDGDSHSNTGVEGIGGIWNDYMVKSIVVNMANEICGGEREMHDKVRINLGDGIGQMMGKYVDLRKRERLETAKEINARWKGKKRCLSSESQ